MFNFNRLIKKYSKVPVYELKESPGYRDPTQGGIYVPGKVEEIIIDGAVVPLSNNDLKLDEGGVYTTEDRKLYCYRDIKEGTKIKHKEKEYTVMEKRDYSDYDEGLYIYVLKRGGTG